MSEFTKGRLKAKGGDIYTGEFGEGTRLVQMIPTGLGNETANAAELVRRWNCHEALLDVCKEMVAYWGEEDYGQIWQDILDKAKAAIAQAKE